ncbi:MAG TPA: amidase [Blastocatellia bacterium]|nr:amidase [Blastocatellia bacterium]
MTELNFQSATKLAELVRAKDVSPVEVVEAYIRRIEEVNPKLNAYVTTTFDSAREAARNAEQQVMRGETLGLMTGVPVSIKDTIDTAGVRTVAGTRLRETYVPEADAPVVARLKQAGAIILGKTNVPELAMDYRSENVVFGRTNNPWDVERVPGGSSGGEGAAISSGCSAAGIGSDLGGSVRVPSHFCGIVGLKTTPGRIPGSGHFPACVGPFALGASLGPMARRVEDLALMLKVLAAFDPSDSMSVPLPFRAGAGAKDEREGRFRRVMWYADDGISPVTEATKQTVRRAAQALAGLGYEVEERRPHGLEHAHDLWFLWLGVPGTGGLIELYKDKEELMGPLMQGLKRVSESQTVALDQYVSAWVGRDLLRASVVNEMMDCPIILAPVVAMPAFRHDQKEYEIEGQRVDYLKMFGYSQAYNLLGLPAVVVPCGRSPEGLPIGVQVVGRPFEEEDVLITASLLEEALGGYQRPPI